MNGRINVQASSFKYCECNMPKKLKYGLDKEVMKVA